MIGYNMFQSHHWRECCELVLVTSWVVPWSKLPTPNGASLWVRQWRDHPTSIPSLLPSYAAIESSYRIISRRKVTFTLHIWMKSLVVERVLLSSFTWLAFAVPRVMGG